MQQHVQYVVVAPDGELHIVTSLGREDAPNMDDMKCSAEVTQYAKSIIAIGVTPDNTFVTSVKDRDNTIWLGKSLPATSS